ncbi:toll/interleukin-1 receptor domain-containing protein [Micromonospora sp. NPDC049301]|uniref:toll/interleukin-1 receptor domain-containing protein n=1 Tax=Micromonospora sp. NPDC049301 TaxID=3155723 RepID=UPI00344693B2
MHIRSVGRLSSRVGRPRSCCRPAYDRCRQLPLAHSRATRHSEAVREVTGASGQAPIFISHAGCDRIWGEWVGWELENAGYRVELGLWDWQLGENVIGRIRDALERCERMIAAAYRTWRRRSRGYIHCRRAGRVGLALGARIESAPPPCRCRPCGPTMASVNVTTAAARTTA